MEIGAFSVSLSVKDLGASLSFYEKIGFKQVGGNVDENWVIMRSGDTTIGLFHGMFKGNILTFNPGWDKNGEKLDSFTDVREIQEKYRSEGILFTSEVETDSEGPGSFMIKDPDGNVILFDQHV